MATKFCEKCSNEVMATMRICPQCGGKAFSATRVPVSANSPGAKIQLAPITTNQNQIVVNRPWVRWLARTFDVYIFIFISSYVASVLLPEFYVRNWLFWSFLSIPLWIFVEAFLLTTFGTTPGKWLLKVNVALASSDDILYSKALSRSAKVCWRGYGLGLPFVQFITSIVAFNNLKKNGVTSWDREEGFLITHKKIGAIRLIVTIIILLAVSAIGQHNFKENVKYEAQKLINETNM